MKFTRQYLIIFTIMVTEVLGFSLILPFLPLYAEQLGASPLIIGLILMSFSLFQFVSAPIMGRLSDHYGRKPLLIFSQLSTFAGFLILGLSNSVWMIFLSRVVDGLLGSNLTIAQAYISDISTKKNRSKAFGVSSAAFGFGFLVGPAVGGLLAQTSFSLPSFMAAGVSFLTILITILFLPETIKKKKNIRINIEIFQFSHFRQYFSDRNLSVLLWEYLLLFVSHSIFVSTFALFADRQLGLDTNTIGLVLAWVGLTSILVRTVLLPKLIDRYGEERLKYAGVISIIISMLGASVFRNVWPFLVFHTLFASGMGVAMPVILGSISRRVPNKKQGTIMGVTGSLGSISRIVGPLIGGFMINYFVPGSVPLISSVVMIIGLLLIVRNTNNINTHKKPLDKS